MRTVSNRAASDRSRTHQSGAGPLYLGIDIGSTSSDVVVLSDQADLLCSDYRRICGKPLETVLRQLKEIFASYPPACFAAVAVTGSAGRLFAEITGSFFANEVPAQAAAIRYLYPDLKQATVIEIGGQDSKFLFLSERNGRLELTDFAFNSSCAAGTGSFLDQQAERLGIRIEEEFGKLALQSKTIPRLAGRCSVFAKSDMIHLQQLATPVEDIVAGLCLALARGLKSNLGGGRTLEKPFLFTGGVAANRGVVRAFEQMLELETGELIVPREHFYTGAIGAVLMAMAQGYRSPTPFSIETVEEYIRHHSHDIDKAPRRPRLPVPALPAPQSRVHDELLAGGEEIEAYLGVDVGSISTNVVIIDRQRRMLAKEYLMTAGRPLEAVRKGLADIRKKIHPNVRIAGAATTGSGRYLTGDFIGADTVINEITAQAAGAALVCPDVDTIFEIGGQDSKYISLENGVVVDFEMNHACAAGTGSFLEEQSQRLGLNIKEEFADLAMQSEAPIRLGERCTVFIESDLLSCQQRGAATQDLAAGLAYSIASNYLNRVVGQRKIGSRICFQGGTAFNKAVWAAFEQITGKPILVPDHHEVTGALGAADYAARHVENLRRNGNPGYVSRFRGFDQLTAIEYSVESFTCSHCPNDCEIRKVQFPGSEPLYYGSRCDRYNLRKKQKADLGFDACRWRNRRMLETAGLDKTATDAKPAGPVVAIPRALIAWQLLPMLSRFIQSLGFEVMLSDPTSKTTIQRGVETVRAQPCFPVKVGFGHVDELLDKQPDYLLIPSIVSMPCPGEEDKSSQLCPYVQSFVYQVRSAFADRLSRTQILSEPLRLGEGKTKLIETFSNLARRLGVEGKRVRRAIEEALTAQRVFERSLVEKGREILNEVKPGERLFVLVSRPYNGLDEGMNLRLPKKLAELGVRIIPMEMLDLSRPPRIRPKLHEQMYWSYGRKILRAAEIIRTDPRLFAVYLTNFSCGPDSFLQTFFKEIMQPKPSLILELDEHSADAGVITRLEAFLESLKNYRPEESPASDFPRLAATAADDSRLTREHTLYFPYMGDAAYGLAAAFRAIGQPAEVTPIATARTLELGRRHTLGKECLPCAVTLGEMLQIACNGRGQTHKPAFFMPSTSGPCRFGMYNCLQGLVLEKTGRPDVIVVAPNQSSRFYREFLKTMGGGSEIAFLKNAWTGAVGIDLLYKVLLRLRPFAADPNRADELYRRLMKDWGRMIEQRTSICRLVAFMEEAATRYEQLDARPNASKPRIGIVGEIYVRNHPFTNNRIIERLESLGAACELASSSEWIYYTSLLRRFKYQSDGRLGGLLREHLQTRMQRQIERRLAAPLERAFGPLAEEPVEHTVELARGHLHPSFEGEAILSIGKMVECFHRGFGGVVNVMPFGCMPSTIVCSLTQRVSEECGGMPILNVNFDGQDDPTLMTRLEAFVEQARQKQSSPVVSAVRG